MAVAANNLPCDRPVIGINRLAESNYAISFSHHCEKELKSSPNRGFPNGLRG